jgi:hypothetical protein
MKFLLVSETPVAGTVCRFASALENSKFVTSSFPFVLKNYKNSPFDLPYGQMSSHQNWSSILGEYAANADHIIFHNCTDQNYIDIAKKSARPSTSLSYHLHSPPFEAPLYSYDIIVENKFDAVFSVAQGYSRFYNNSISIANIIPDIKLFNGRHRRSAVMVGHLRTTNARWSKKIPPDFVKSLEVLLKKDGVDVSTIPKLFGAESVPYCTFAHALQNFDYVVDDVCSGLFHQISLEGLKSGCIVFSAADAYAISSFCEAAQCPPPPFDMISDIYDIYEKVRYYERNPADLRAAQARNLQYAESYLSEVRLADLATSKIISSLTAQ